MTFSIQLTNGLASGLRNRHASPPPATSHHCTHTRILTRTLLAHMAHAPVNQPEKEEGRKVVEVKEGSRAYNRLFLHHLCLFRSTATAAKRREKKHE